MPSRQVLFIIGLTLATAVVNGCYDDVQERFKDHPCDVCQSCELCTLSAGSAVCTRPQTEQCVAREVHLLDSCGEDLGVVDACPAGRCSEATGQAECVCEVGFDGPACDVCAPGWDADDNCASCGGNWTGERCDVCPAPHAGALCDRCDANHDPATNCTACTAGYRDVASGCVKCAAGYMAAGTGCRAICGDGVVVAGETCDDGNDTRTDGCDACKGTPLHFEMSDAVRSIAVDGAGNLAIASIARVERLANDRCLVRVVEAGHSEVTATLDVAASTERVQACQVAFDNQGRLVVVYLELAGLFVRKFDLGAPDTAESPVLLSTQGTIDGFALTVTERSEVMVSWRASGPARAVLVDDGGRVTELASVHEVGGQVAKAVSGADGAQYLFYKRTDVGSNGVVSGTRFAATTGAGSALPELLESSLAFDAAVAMDGTVWLANQTSFRQIALVSAAEDPEAGSIEFSTDSAATKLAFTMGLSPSGLPDLVWIAQAGESTLNLHAALNASSEQPSSFSMELGRGEQAVVPAQVHYARGTDGDVRILWFWDKSASWIDRQLPQVGAVHLSQSGELLGW